MMAHHGWFVIALHGHPAASVFLSLTVDASMPLVSIPLTTTSPPLSHLHRHQVLVQDTLYLDLFMLCSILGCSFSCGLVDRERQQPALQRHSALPHESSLHFTISRLAARNVPSRVNRLVSYSRWAKSPTPVGGCHSRARQIVQHSSRISKSRYPWRLPIRSCLDGSYLIRSRTVRCAYLISHPPCKRCGVPKNSSWINNRDDERDRSGS